MATCILCDSEATLTDFPHTAMQKVQCGMCGEYQIANLLISQLPDKQGWTQTQEILSKAARSASDAGTSLQLGGEADVLSAIARYLPTAASERPRK